MPENWWSLAPPGYKLRSEIEGLKRRRNIFVPGDEEEPPINPFEEALNAPENYPQPQPVFAQPPQQPFTPAGIQAFRGGGPPGAPSPFRQPEPEEVSTAGPSIFQRGPEAVGKFLKQPSPFEATEPIGEFLRKPAGEVLAPVGKAYTKATEFYSSQITEPMAAAIYSLQKGRGIPMRGGIPDLEATLPMYRAEVPEWNRVADQMIIDPLNFVPVFGWTKQLAKLKGLTKENIDILEFGRQGLVKKYKASPLASEAGGIKLPRPSEPIGKASKAIETSTRDIVSTDVETFNKLNPILKSEVTANIRKKIPELEEMISTYDSEVYGLTEALKENVAKDYIGLLQKQGTYRGEVQFLTPAQYRQMTGATWQTKKITIGDKVVNKRMLVGGREAPPGAKDKQGRIVFEYAADELADRLYPPEIAAAHGYSSSTDMFRAEIHKAKALIQDLDDAKRLLAEANEDWRSYNIFLEMAETKLPTPEVGMPEAGIQAGFGGETKVVRPEGKGKIIQISMEDQLKLAQARQAAEVARADKPAEAVAPGVVGQAAPLPPSGKLADLIPEGRDNMTLRQAYQAAKEKGLVQTEAEFKTLLDSEIKAGTVSGGSGTSSKSPLNSRLGSGDVVGYIERPSKPLAQAGKEAKQSWQMTQKEYIATGTPLGQREAGQVSLKSFHERDVRWAVEDGKPVPPEVLAEYPDLAARFKPAEAVASGAEIAAPIARPERGVPATAVPPPIPPVSATPKGQGVRGIPPIPPSLAPTGPAPGVIPKGVQDALDAMGAIVQRLAPGRTTKIIDTIPGLKQTQRWLFNKSLGVREQVMKGFLGLNHVGAMESSQLQAKLLPNLRQLEDSFGKGTVSGVSDAARYIGTDAERVPFSGKLLDVVERPNLYDLTPEQQTLLMNIQADKSATLAEIKTRYGFTLNEYPTPKGSVHVPHSDISKDAMARAKARRGQETTITQQSTEPRPYVTAAERWLHDRALFDQGKITADQVFKPNLNVGELLNADNNLLASLASHEVFKTSLAGKTKLQLYQELHPGKIPDAKILDEFNPRGYVFVEGGGLNLYYETQDAEQIIRMLKRSNNPGLRFIDNMRATAFGGDLSPATIQGLNAWMMDPVGVSKTLGSEMKSAAQARNLFNAWTLDAVAKDVRDNPEKWKRVSLYTGIDPMGGIHGVASFNREEFGAGFLSKIPKVGKYWEKFNDGMYRPVSKTMGDGFESIYQAGLNAGLTREQAGAIAADDLMRLTMRYDYVRLGLSQAEAAHRRALLTSVSFLVQPVALMSDAAKGILKIGAFQKVTPVELYAVKRVLTLSAMATAASVSTAVLYAKNHGLDPEKAAIKAANPVNWAFTNPKNGDRYTIGGPFRSIMRAVAPGDVPGVPYPVPFAGIGRYAKSKLHPAISTGFNLKENQDYFGRQIMTGDFPANVLQGLEYAGASALPLTGGVAVKGAMAGASPEYIAKQTASQFAGVNMSEDTNAKLQAEAIRQGKLTLQPGESIQDYPKIKADIENTPEGRAIIERSKRLTPLEQLSQSRSDRMAENDKALGEWTGTGWSNGQRPDPAKPGQMILYTINDWKKDLSEIYKEAATEWATRERIVGEFKGKEPKDEKGKARWDYYKIADRFKEKDKDGKPIPNGKIQDMDGFIQAQDEYLAGLTPELEKHVLDNLGIHDNELATQFRENKRQLRDYFNRDEILSKAWEKTYHYNPEHYLTLAKIARKRGTAQGLADAQAYEQTYRLKDYERFKVQKTQKYLEANPQVDMLVWKWGYRDNPVNPTERQRMGLQPLPGQGIISPKTSSGIGKIPSKIGAR